MTTTAAATAKLLADAGIERVFGLPGGEVLVLMDELRRVGVDFVLMRHEANAGIAAAVYGKLRGQPGVVLTTLGPGAANLMLPLSSSYLDQEPLLAISAQIPDDFPASHTHQLLPLHDVYRPVTRYASKITAQNAEEAVARALAACMERPFGAAYLTLSAREALKAVEPIVGADLGRPLGEALRAPFGPSGQASSAPTSGASPASDSREKAKELTSLLANAKRPLVVIGLGIDPSIATRLRQWLLANLRDALLLTTSNRSEAAVGYATMDGDTCGGLAPIAGIDKAFILDWLKWMEKTGPAGIGPLPALSVVNNLKPTAELRPPSADQTDEADLMPYRLLDAIERAAIRDKLLPIEVFEVVRPQFSQYETQQIGTWVERFFRLWCRNQWKRERYAPSFHLDDENLDPKTWCRFPILNSGFEKELAELREYVRKQCSGQI